MMRIDASARRGGCELFSVAGGNIKVRRGHAGVEESVHRQPCGAIGVGDLESVKRGIKDRGATCTHIQCVCVCVRLGMIRECQFQIAF